MGQKTQYLNNELANQRLRSGLHTLGAIRAQMDDLRGQVSQIANIFQDLGDMCLDESSEGFPNGDAGALGGGRELSSPRIRNTKRFHDGRRDDTVAGRDVPAEDAY